MTSPLFSILIANYNNGKYFEDCYQSIIAQTYTNWEVIIVDDGSTDDSVTLIRQLIGDDARFKLSVNSENKGCGYTKRKCAELAEGGLCAFLDPDDAITPNALAVMVEEHEKHPEASMIYSQPYYCDEFLNIQHSRQSYQVENNDPYFFNFDGTVFAFISYKKSFYDRTEGINAYLLRAVDQDLVFKLYEVGTVIHCKELLYKYRIHKGGISTNSNVNKAYFWHWVAIIDAAKRRNINIEDLFLELALKTNRERALEKELKGYNNSIIFKIFRKLGFFKI